MHHLVRLVAPLALIAACSSSSSKPPPVIESKAPAPETKPAPAPTVAIAVVIEAQHLWLGNDTWWTKAPSAKTPGLYAAVTTSLDHLAKANLPGAQVIVIAAGDQGSVRYTGPLAQLVGAKIGTQQELTTMPNRDGDGNLLAEVLDSVSPGIDEATAELAKRDAQKKLLLVIGDGEGSDDYPKEKAALDAAKIDTYAIYLQSPTDDLPGDPNGFKKLTANLKALDRGDTLPAAVDAIAASWAH